MRKLILGVIAATAAAVPLALNFAPANAADPITTAGTMDTVTYAQGGTYTHHWTTTYTCTADANGKSIINLTFVGDGQNGTTNSGNGSGVLTPDSKGGGTFAFTGNNGGYVYTYGGTYASGGAWNPDTTASANDGTYSFGDVTTAGNFGSIHSGSFSGVPNCTTPEVPPTVTGNHGEFVSGANKYGIKGQALAKIAKDVSLVGPFDINKVPN